MRRIDDIPSEPPIPLSALEDPEVRKYIVELQRSMICWEPWLLKTWSMEKVGSLGLNDQYCETLAMTSAACLENLKNTLSCINGLEITASLLLRNFS